jgi:hypothetical protein
MGFGAGGGRAGHERSVDPEETLYVVFVVLFIISLIFRGRPSV